MVFPHGAPENAFRANESGRTDIPKIDGAIGAMLRYGVGSGSFWRWDGRGMEIDRKNWMLQKTTNPRFSPWVLARRAGLEPATLRFVGPSTPLTCL